MELFTEADARLGQWFKVRLAVLNGGCGTINVPAFTLTLDLEICRCLYWICIGMRAYTK